MPATGAVLIVANHSSFLDPPLVGGMAPAAADVPGQGGAVPRAGPGPAHPTAERASGASGRAPTWPRSSIAQRALAEGRALLVFPEGTRGDEGQLREAKPGAGLLAVRQRGAGGAGLRERQRAGLAPRVDGFRGLLRWW